MRKAILAALIAAIPGVALAQAPINQPAPGDAFPGQSLKKPKPAVVTDQFGKNRLAINPDGSINLKIEPGYPLPGQK